MAEIKLNQVELSVLPTTIEQKIAAGSQFTGEVPSLGGNAFAPYFDSADGLYRMKQGDNPANVEGDKGGLFIFTGQQPFALEQLLADLGTSILWTVSVVNSAGEVPVATATSRYIAMKAYVDAHVLLSPGDKIKLVTTGATVAMWARVVGRLVQTMGA